MAYLMEGQSSEFERLTLQARVWEPAGERLLDVLGDGTGRRAVDIGCGCWGWLRILSRWVGTDGSVVGTDVAPEMLALARRHLDDEGLGNVELAGDDLFDSRLEPGSFDLVHARFQLAPLGRMSEQLDAFSRLLAPGGILVLEDPDTASWTFTPEAPALERLLSLVREAFLESGGDFDAGRAGYELLGRLGLEPQLRAEVVALEPNHPYLRLPVQFATSLRPRLLRLVAEPELDLLLTACEDELAQPGRRGLTFTLIQTWARTQGGSAWSAS